MLWRTHQKILEDEIPFAAGQWRAAIPARYLEINRVGSYFDFDDAIERAAIRAKE
jgi:hypothetical protein